MTDSALHYMPATQLVAHIRDKSLSPVELMMAVISRAESLNPQLNAICTPTFETAMDQAKDAEALVMGKAGLAPLHGIPTTIKDLALTRGVRTMAGSHVFAQRIPDTDHAHVERMRAAGMISIGKTTTSEFGWSGVSNSPLTGITHNPWKHGMNAGASSAGAAVCAAAGIGPVHQGSDGAGSIRMPAAFCGVYGIKPSHGRVPYYPMPQNGLISHVGPISRTVGDAALMLRAIAGPDDRDMTTIDAPPEDYVARLDDGIAGLKVAYSPDLGYLKVDDDVATPVREAVKAFEEAGCRVEELNPGWGDPIDMEHCLFATTIAMMWGGFEEQWGKKMDPGLVAMIHYGRQYTAMEYTRAAGERLLYYDKVRAFFDKYDLLLTPSVSVAAFPAVRIIPEHWEQHQWDWLRWAGFSYPFNLTWLPAATCPCGFTAAGLPVGIQIVAGRNRDLRVLQASRAFELARPWAGDRPIP
ncbi:MAG: amidase [Burkholderiales bacterium]|jgi:aspartyl-tRNA(Asn)/glutamyl-tRNA(Gln) amidotransferase subunit A